MGGCFFVVGVLDEMFQKGLAYSFYIVAVEMTRLRVLEGLFVFVGLEKIVHMVILIARHDTENVVGGDDKKLAFGSRTGRLVMRQSV